LDVGEPSAERVEIGQSAGIEFGVNGLGEISFARPIMSGCQQADMVRQACSLLSPSSNASKAR
jgi:hypothetical protein